jgi:integrase
VFAATFGGPIDHRSDTRCFKTLLIKARVRCDEIVGADGSVRVEPRVRLHDLRHTAATLLQMSGVAFDASSGGFWDYCAATDRVFADKPVSAAWSRQHAVV